MTMLIASHDLAMVHEAFPRMIIMDEGRIVADGAPPSCWRTRHC